MTRVVVGRIQSLLVHIENLLQVYNRSESDNKEKRNWDQRIRRISEHATVIYRS